MSPDKREELIICRGIAKSYGDTENPIKALKDINLVVYKGEMTFLVGPSGCGKTTLLSIMGTILCQDQGELFILGSSVAKMNEHDITMLRRRHFGFIFQSFYLIPSMSVLENVSIPLIIKGINRNEALESAFSMLIRIGMSHRAHAAPKQLSNGQQQRVAIARALVHNPDVVICDEPTSALDQIAGFTAMQLLRDIALDENRGVIIVTHDKRMYRFADRIAKMNDGVIQSIVRPEDEIE